MPAIATTIFKIKATADYIAPSKELISFRKGQPFYALAADYERGVYHVSTQYATPFSRTAVAGIVPMALFVQVDLMSNDASAVSKSASVVKKNMQQQQKVLNPQPRRPSLPLSKDKTVANEAIEMMEVLYLQPIGNNIDVYHIRVVRGDAYHLITRTTLDLVQLHKELMSIHKAAFPISEGMDQGIKQERIEVYLNSLCRIQSTFTPFLEFARPKQGKEFELMKRRDSGFDERRQRGFRRFTQMFGY